MWRVPQETRAKRGVGSSRQQRGPLCVFQQGNVAATAKLSGRKLGSKVFVIEDGQETGGRAD